MVKEKVEVKIEVVKDDIKFINDSVIHDVVIIENKTPKDEVKQTTHIDDVIFWF